MAAVVKIRKQQECVVMKMDVTRSLEVVAMVQVRRSHYAGLPHVKYDHAGGITDVGFDADDIDWDDF